MRGGSCSTKKGWNALISFSAVPICPSSVEPITDIFHVVMLSASLNFSCARPCLSVSSDDCHTSVSGKYSRRRGVDDCELPDFVTTFTFFPRRVSCLPFTRRSVTLAFDIEV